MSKQRNLSDDEILYILMNELDIKNGDYDINQEKCRKLGMFTYSIESSKEKIPCRLFLICELRDEKEVFIIYDNMGRHVASPTIDFKTETFNELNVEKGIELDEELLKRQIQLGEERTKNGGTTGSTNAGNGRDIADKEHEEKKPDNKPKETENKNQEEPIKNLKYEINLDGKTKIRLDEVVNGYYLWDILQIEEKLKGKMPQGISEQSFRSGYLTTIPVNELPEDEKNKISKEYGENDVPEYVMAMCTREGDIVRLDNTILEYEGQRTDEDKKISANTSLNMRDGKETEKSQTRFDLTTKATFKIPDANNRYSVAEDWGIQVDLNRDYMKTGTVPLNGNIEEISFWQVSRNESEMERRLGRNRYVTKFEAINESTAKTDQEIEQQKQLSEKDANEATTQRAEHTNELVDKCFEKYKNLGEYYNKSDITTKIEKYHNDYGMNDEQVLEQIGLNLKEAKDLEHEFPTQGEKHNH